MPFIPTGPTNYSKETGGNLASVKTDSDTIVTNTSNSATNSGTIATNTTAISTSSGTVADTTYTTGSGSVISILKGIFGKLSSTLGISGSVSVSNFPVTQPVSGTVTANAGTNLNTSALATSTNQTNASQKTQIVDGSGNVIGSTSNALNVNVTSGGGSNSSVSTNNVTAPGFSTEIGIIDSSGKLQGASSSNPVPVSGTFYQTTQPVSLASLPALTTGSATIGSVEITDGTNTANVVSGDSGFNGIATASATKTYTWTTSGTGAQTISIGGNSYVNCEGFDTVSIITTVSGTGATGTAQFSATSGGTYVVSSLFQNSSLSSNFPGSFGFSTAGYLVGPVLDNFMKLVVTALTSGTYSGTLTLSNRHTFQTNIYATQSATWTVQPGNAVNTTPWLTTDSGTSATGATVPAKVANVGGLAKTTNPTAASDGNTTEFLTDKLGKLISVGSVRDLKINTPTTITSSTSETTVLAAVASVFLDVYGVIVTNTSATACSVSFKDSTSGTTQFTIYVPAGDTRGFMLHEGGAIKQTTVNNNWTATCSASVASVIITMLAVKNI